MPLFFLVSDNGLIQRDKDDTYMCLWCSGKKLTYKRHNKLAVQKCKNPQQRVQLAFVQKGNQCQTAGEDGCQKSSDS